VGAKVVSEIVCRRRSRSIWWQSPHALSFLGSLELAKLRLLLNLPSTGSVSILMVIHT